MLFSTCWMRSLRVDLVLLQCFYEGCSMKPSLMRVRKTGALTIIFLAIFGLPVAMAGEVRKEFLSEFVLGKYLLVGKNVDSTSAYFGHVDIYIF